MQEIQETIAPACDYCGVIPVLAGSRRCCSAGRDVDKLRAQLEVAEAGYLSAVRTAEHQTQKYTNYNTLLIQLENLKVVNALLTDMLGGEIPKIEIELPDGDPRKVKVWFSELRNDGKWHLCISLEEPK